MIESANSPTTARRAKRGAGTNAGRCRARPSSRAMSFCRAGVGATRLTGPAISSWSMRCVSAATSSTSVIHGHHSRPVPIGPPRPSLPSSSSGEKAPPSGDMTRPVRAQATGRPASMAGCVASSHRVTTPARKSLAGSAPLGEHLVAAVAVVADGRCVDEADRASGLLLDPHEGLGHRAGGIGAAALDLPLVLGVPPLVADADAGEVDDGIDLAERRRRRARRATDPTAARPAPAGRGARPGAPSHRGR